MKPLTEILQMIGRAVDSLDWERSPRELYAPIEYTLALGGKRIRPALSLMAADMFDGGVSQLHASARRCDGQSTAAAWVCHCARKME